MKYYIPRRLLALALSIAMVLSMMCTAFATETGTTDTDPFDFSAESTAEVSSDSDSESDESTDAESNEATSEEGEASDAEESTESSTEAKTSTESDSATVTVSSVSTAVAASEENTENVSEEATNTETTDSKENTTVEITSDNVKNGYLYVDGTLYDGYYMDNAGLMFKVSEGVYNAYSGNLNKNQKYYKEGTGTLKLTAGFVYISGEVYTGYYMTGSNTLYYTDATSGYATYSGHLSSSSTYVSSVDFETHQATSTIYLDGKLYTGFYTKGNVMYKANEGVFSKYSGNLNKGQEYFKDGSGMLTLSAGFVYISGKVYTGYYMTSSGTLYYTDATSGYATYSGHLSSSSTYVSSVDFETYQATSTIYLNGKLYTGFYTKDNVMYKANEGIFSKYSGNLNKGQEYFKDGSGILTLSAGFVYISGKVYTGFYKTSSGYVYYTDSTSGYALYSGTVFSGTDYVSSVDMQTYTFSGNRVYVKGVLYTGYYMTTANVMYTVTDGVFSRYTGTLSSGTKYYMSGTGYITLSVNTEYEDGICLTGTWKFSNNYAYYYVGGKKVTGWYYIERNGSTYKYYFDPDDGHLVTNLYAYFGSSYKYKKCKLVINLSTRNASLLGYDSSTNSYCIPFYSFIIGTSKTGQGPQAGNTYALSSNVQKKWFTFADNGTDYYYAYATLISGSGAYLHSERYSTSGNLNTLVASTYNGLGTKQSSLCIRAQLYVAKLVYDVRQCYSGSIKVQVVSNSTYGPFGKITLSSTTGKISSSTKTDPTGSSSYKGYIKQTAE